MRDFAVVLRSELESLEAALAADPRTKKAQRIRELLAMYGDARYSPTCLLDTSSATHSEIVPAVRASKGELILYAIQSFMRPRGSATLARMRLAQMAATNHWPNALQAPVQLREASSSDGLISTPAPVSAVPSDRAPRPNGHS